MTESTKQKKLYRSGTNHMVAGVCAGVADYMNIDPIIIRIAWFLTIFLNGLGLLGYLVCMIFMPLNPEHAALPPSERKRGQMGLLIGILLVVVGIGILTANFMGHFCFWFDFPWFGYWPFNFKLIWPLVIIAFGIWYIIYSAQKDKNKGPEQQGETTFRKLTRIKSNRMVSGVCSGLADYWNVDVALVRIGFVLFTLMTHFIVGIGVYIAMAIIVPEAETMEQQVSVSNGPDQSSK